MLRKIKVIEVKSADIEISKYAINKLKQINYIKQDDWIFIDKKRDGQYIKIYYENNYIEYIVYSNWSFVGKSFSRNTYIKQRLPIALKHLHQDKKANSKIDFKIKVLYLNLNERKPPKSIIFDYKLIKTLNIETLNDEIYNGETKFKSVFEIQKFRFETIKKNNSPTVIFDVDNQVQFFCRCDGTLENEVIIILLILTKIWKRKTMLYQIYKEKKDIWSTERLKNRIWFLTKYNHLVDYSNWNNALYCKNVNGNYLSIKSNDVMDGNIKRNQNLFISNLYLKYGFKFCFFCDCEIDNIIDGAHLFEVQKIKQDENLNKEAKQTKINSGDNGIWLCKNHHKLFDNGSIKINIENENKKLLIDKEILKWKNHNIQEKKFCNYFKDYFNTEMINNLKKRY